MPRDTADRLAIRDLIENWVLWRDARMWDRFRTVWHKDGQMWATWFQGSYEDFIRVSQEGYDRGVRIMHMLGGMSIDIKGKRAIAQTKMTISQRAKVVNTEPLPPLPMNRFSPFRTHEPSACFTARLSMW